MTRSQKAAETRKRNAETAARIAAIRAETLKIVASAQCPQCGAGLRLNSAIAGWYQCDQYGAEGFRKDSSKPACSWQGFTE